MNLFTLTPLIFENLSRRKGRVVLTAIGVLIGTAAVVVLVSLGIGLQRSATANLYGIGDLTVIQVYPGFGGEQAYSDPVGPPSPGVPSQTTLITDKSLADFAAMPGVVAVVPRDFLMGEARFKLERLEAYAGPLGMGLEDLTQLGWTPEQGELVLERGTVVVGAMYANNFIDPNPRPNQEPPAPPDLLGKTLKLTLIKYDADGVEIRKSYPVKVAGVIAARADETDWGHFMSLEDVITYNEWFSGRRINRAQVGYGSAMVKVGDPQETMAVYERIVGQGYQAYTPQDSLQGINSFYLVMQITFGGVGAIALLVAAIGIANTMTMAILERTREIGLIKAVGATNSDVLAIFLGESAGIGLLGGLGGILFGWSAGQVVNVLAMVYTAGQWSEQGGPPPNFSVVTPAWLLGFALVFATLLGLVSGIYPALRAAMLPPVVALKYE